MEFLFNSTTGAVERAISTKGETDVGTTSLEQDGRCEQNGENDLDNVENHSERSIPNFTFFVKNACDFVV